MLLRESLKRIPGLRRLVKRLRGDHAKDRHWLLSEIPRGGVGVEIGVHVGDFSAEILSIARPKVLHLVDPWRYEGGKEYRHAWFGSGVSRGQDGMDLRYEGVRRRFAREIGNGQVMIHRASSHDAASAFQRGSLDWVYVDGNHLEEYVRDDLETYLPLLRPGGLLTGDDYGVPGWWHDGVTLAVDAFVAAHPALRLDVEGDQFIIRT